MNYTYSKSDSHIKKFQTECKKYKPNLLAEQLEFGVFFPIKKIVKLDCI